ncbi:hypothetical protein [Stenotrophomonas sp.]|uniref:hypothetical protein n=1 Tax=Stenotrophomonas sp. TaxID=69392 RepID=UPI0028A8521C|nr:hypothetical protein [Stenotrophomonas sp.]
MSLGYIYAVYAGNMILCGMFGSFTRLRVAALRTSTESIDSPNRWTRGATRYLFFQVWLLFSSGLSLLYAMPLINALAAMSVPKPLWMGIYLLSCVPLAVLLYRWDLRIVRRADARKLAGREAFRKRWLDR